MTDHLDHAYQYIQIIAAAVALVRLIQRIRKEMAQRRVHLADLAPYQEEVS